MPLADRHNEPLRSASTPSRRSMTAINFNLTALAGALFFLSACSNALDNPPSARKPAWAGEQQMVTPQVGPETTPAQRQLNEP